MKLKIIERLTVLIGLSSVKGFPSSAAISFVTVGYMSPATNFYSVTQDTLSTRSTELSSLVCVTYCYFKLKSNSSSNSCAEFSLPYCLSRVPRINAAILSIKRCWHGHLFLSAVQRVKEKMYLSRRAGAR